MPVPHAERLIDTMLAHPLWLTRHSGHRRGEVEALARRLLGDALPRWRSGQRVSFGPGDEPGLQGTEMWLAIVWYLADLVGQAEALRYRPRGIHRPEPAAEGRSPAPISR
ncbi:hypothetical protein [Microbacterium lacticum]|uniref:hypothetical protein n=1 Tax=Microbacterium lacticum TaxID=33885 RepID=UPI0018B03215|nr:hypothetical protein [Microbacterium lacticum]